MDFPLPQNFIPATASALLQKHINMADTYPDHDSAFGDDDQFWIANPMFSTPAVAGTKRDVGELTAEDSTSLGQGEDIDKHIDPSVLCCDHCPEPCPDGRAVRPTKRRASAQKVAAYHNLTTESHPIDADCQFPDDCFEKFCQECHLDAPCPPECVVPCAADTECSTPDACWDPHCDTKEVPCTDGCVDPDCTKLSCPEETCFCQKCDLQPCPLGDPTNECHSAHTAPTTTGTIYCYDTAPCHFQEGYHGNNDSLASFETYPCFSPTHGYLHHGDSTTQPSSAPTPVLSHSNYTSLESAFTSEPSPGPSNFSNCFLGVLGEHCHIDNSCCHGSKRACGDCPTGSPNQLDLWNSSMAQGNGLANNFMNFGLSSMPTSPMTATPFSNGFDNSMLGFNDNSWMFVDPSLSTPYQGDLAGLSKLDFLASAVQQDLLASTSSSMRDTRNDSTSTSVRDTSDAQQCVCKWYVQLSNKLRPQHAANITNTHAGNTPQASSASRPFPLPKRSTNTPKPPTSTTAPHASANGSPATHVPKTSNSAPNSRATCSATQATGHTHAATHPAAKLLQPTKPKTTTSAPTRASDPTSATAAATPPQPTPNYKPTSPRYTRARNHTNAASATSLAQTAVISANTNAHTRPCVHIAVRTRPARLNPIVDGRISNAI
jgi:hypothetical protein